ASGKIRAEDYRDVVLPTLERAAATGEVRFVMVMRDFDGMSGGAVWQDLKVGIEHLRAWKRIALVTDITWMRDLTSLFGWMTPGEVKTFRIAELPEATAWAAGCPSGVPSLVPAAAGAGARWSGRMGACPLAPGATIMMPVGQRNCWPPRPLSGS